MIIYEAILQCDKCHLSFTSGAPGPDASLSRISTLNKAQNTGWETFPDDTCPRCRKEREEAIVRAQEENA